LLKFLLETKLESERLIGFLVFLVQKLGQNNQNLGK